MHSYRLLHWRFLLLISASIATALCLFLAFRLVARAASAVIGVRVTQSIVVQTGTTRNELSLEVEQGTEILPEDRAAAEESAAPFAFGAFLQTAQETNAFTRSKFELLDFNRDGRITEQESERAEEAAGAGEDDAERARISALFHDQGDPRSPPRDIRTDLSEEEKDRIHRLFQDQDLQRPARGSSVPARCGRTRYAYLNVIPSDLLFCGERGFTFDGLMGEDCPLSACILRYGPSDGFDEVLGAR